ncbi:MAG: hypothetical protein H6834_18705, partial [Planctomycetes bacterium]|nr:hypothetical protein [Planctomycetota bacterium]
MRSLTMSLRWTLAIASCGLASAQVPRDFLLVLEDVDPSTQGTAFHFVERQGAVTAPLRD